MTKARDLANGASALSAVSATELSYLDGVSSAVQTQIDSKLATSTASSTYIPKTLTTTTGDIIYASGANTPARLSIGSTSQVLTVSSGIPAWTTPAPSGSMTLLSTTSFSGTTTTVSSISGSYKKLIAVINGLSLSTDQGTVWMRINSDTGANYDSSAWDGSGNMVLANELYLMGNVDAPTALNGMEITIPDYANTDSYKYMYWIGSGIRGTDVPSRYQHTGHWASTSAITSLSFIASSGTIDAGTVKIYGVN